MHDLARYIDSVIGGKLSASKTKKRANTAVEFANVMRTSALFIRTISEQCLLINFSRNNEDISLLNTIMNNILQLSLLFLRTTFKIVGNFRKTI